MTKQMSPACMGCGRMDGGHEPACDAGKVLIDVGNVRVVSTGGGSFAVFVNGEKVRCRTIRVSGGVGQPWQASVDFHPHDKDGQPMLHGIVCRPTLTEAERQDILRSVNNIKSSAVFVEPTYGGIAPPADRPMGDVELQELPPFDGADSSITAPRE